MHVCVRACVELRNGTQPRDAGKVASQAIASPRFELGDQRTPCGRQFSLLTPRGFREQPQFGRIGGSCPYTLILKGRKTWTNRQM